MKAGLIANSKKLKEGALPGVAEERCKRLVGECASVFLG
jgi:hypothetical protein